MWPGLCTYLRTVGLLATPSLGTRPPCTLSGVVGSMRNRWPSLSSLILSGTHGGILIKTHLTLHPSK